jgi:hypothetical protein
MNANFNDHRSGIVPGKLIIGLQDRIYTRYLDQIVGLLAPAIVAGNFADSDAVRNCSVVLARVLERVEAHPTDYVFSGAESSKHLAGLPKVWARVAECAKIDGVSLHGLRHWFASAAAEMNFSELTIAGLLGHAVKGVTARYATAPDSALLAAADRVALRISDALDGKEGAVVVSISSSG